MLPSRCGAVVSEMEVRAKADSWNGMRISCVIKSASGISATRRSNYGEQVMRESGSLPAAYVMVVIPAHNEAASIRATLLSLRQQTRPPDEVLVVCDNCTDDTAAIAAACGARVFVTQGNTARKAGALNQALRQALPALDGSDLVL